MKDVIDSRGKKYYKSLSTLTEGVDMERKTDRALRWMKEHPILTAIVIITVAFSIVGSPVIVEVASFIFALVAATFGAILVGAVASNIFFPKATKAVGKGIFHYLEYFSIEAYFHKKTEKKAKKQGS